jgi:uncharacterized membrane protein YhdT
MWALVCCPVIGWVAAAYGNQATQGRLGVTGAVALMAVLPAALASLGVWLVRRDARAGVKAGFAAAVVCWLGFVLFVVLFFLTRPPEFF